jgi:hypothetical protein
MEQNIEWKIKTKGHKVEINKHRMGQNIKSELKT